MHRPRRLFTVLLAAVAAVALAPSPLVAHASVVPGTSCSLFPGDNVWHADVSRLPLDPKGPLYMLAAGSSALKLHPDFGAYPYGMPVNVASSTHATGTLQFQYASESDPGPYPVGADIKLEGTPNDGGDDHALTVNSTTCTLYEVWHAQLATQPYSGGSGAVFDLNANGPLRPAGWTSADAAGLPILPGLLSYDEVLAGSVDHAIRFTMVHSQNSYIWPARHQAGTTGPMFPPMGERFRLQSTFNAAGYSAAARTVITAMQHHGLILADNGSNWFFQGTQDSRWPDALIAELKTIPASSFEAIDESSLMLDPNSGAARQCGGPCT
ncbi:MAG TPA: hypothetical protein VGQ42_12700 [Candidatus Dormibacteraeota bacterium]|jgi:hypothetical protein|nr:hypothetical protein [Candidatus Dormibacteraeota bacterium]